MNCSVTVTVAKNCTGMLALHSDWLIRFGNSSGV